MDAGQAFLQAFLAQRPPALGTPASVSAADLLRGAFAEGQAAGFVGASAVTFGRRVAASVAGVASDGLEGTVRALHLADLCLASACVDRSTPAIQTFHARYLTAAATGPLGLPATVEDEARQVLAERLLVSAGTAPPRLAAYAGRGPLGSWVAVAARRTALNLVRRSSEVSLTERISDALARAPSDGDALERARARLLIEEGLRAAVASLDARERMLLGLSVVKGHSLPTIAAVYGVDGSTVSRWLARARARVLLRLRQHLQVRHALDPLELQSLAGLAASQVDASLSGLLAQ